MILFSILNRYFDTTEKSAKSFGFNCLREFGMMAIFGLFCHSKFRSKTHYNTKSGLCQGLFCIVSGRLRGRIGRHPQRQTGTPRPRRLTRDGFFTRAAPCPGTIWPEMFLLPSPFPAGLPISQPPAGPPRGKTGQSRGVEMAVCPPGEDGIRAPRTLHPRRARSAPIGGGSVRGCRIYGLDTGLPPGEEVGVTRRSAARRPARSAPARRGGSQEGG